MASRDIKYTGRDFDSLKAGLIEFAKAYYPESYTDFNEASPGSLFIDLAAYVGDVLSYYTDSNLKESLITYAQERRSLLNLASSLGYKPKIAVPAHVDIDVYQLMPAIGSGTNSEPDTSYGLRIEPGFEVRSTKSAVTFTIQDTVDFKINNAFNVSAILLSFSCVHSCHYYILELVFSCFAVRTRNKVTCTHTFRHNTFWSFW